MKQKITRKAGIFSGVLMGALVLIGGIYLNVSADPGNDSSCEYCPDCGYWAMVCDRDSFCSDIIGENNN